MTGISRLVGGQPVETWRQYLAFRALERASSVLPKAFVEEQFAFYGRVLTGTPKLRDRWKGALEATDAALGEMVGRLYVERYFPPAEKARAAEMVRDEIVAFERRIDRLDWMAAETKAKAKAQSCPGAIPESARRNGSPRRIDSAGSPGIESPPSQ